MLIKKTAEELEGDDRGGRAFALFLCPHPGAFRQLLCPRGICPFFKENANARGLARVGGGGGGGRCWNLLIHF